MIVFIVLEVLTALLAGVACVAYWRDRSPRRKKLAAVALCVCAASAFTTTLVGSLPGRYRPSPEQLEALWRERQRQYQAAGRYVGEQHPGARVLLLLPADPYCDPDGTRAVAAVEAAAEGRLVSVTPVISAANTAPPLLLPGMPTDPQDEQLRREAARTFDAIVAAHPEATVIVDHMGLCLGFRPRSSRYGWDADSRPKLVEAMPLMLEEVEAFLRNGWLEAAVVMSPIPPEELPTGTTDLPVDCLFVRADEVDAVKARFDGLMFPPDALAHTEEEPAGARVPEAPRPDTPSRRVPHPPLPGGTEL